MKIIKIKDRFVQAVMVGKSYQTFKGVFWALVVFEIVKIVVAL